MSAESSFKAHCGPNVKFISTELFDQGRRREFAFKINGRMYVRGVWGAPEDELGIKAAKEAMKLEKHND